MNSKLISILIGMAYCIIGRFNEASFSNQVKYPSIKETYHFDFEITHALSMSIWNETRKTYRPVVKINDSFFMRNRKSTASCDSLEPLNKSLADSVIKVAGRHRNMLLVNKMFPGTPIVVPLNSNVEVRVRNNLISEAISIHWHGQTQQGTFYMDGVSRVTQCSVGPGETFTYKFKATDVGTHFYHAHTGMQRNEGLYGPFIVTDTRSKPNQIQTNFYDKEFYFIVQDWFQENSNSLLNRVIWEEIKFINGFEDLKNCYNSTRVDDGTAGTMLPFDRETDAILINGKV